MRTLNVKKHVASSARRAYKTWYVEDENGNGKLVTWNDIKSRKTEKKLVGSLQANQNPFKLENDVIYRTVYGKKIVIAEIA